MSCYYESLLLFSFVSTPELSKRLMSGQGSYISPVLQFHSLMQLIHLLSLVQDEELSLFNRQRDKHHNNAKSTWNAEHWHSYYTDCSNWANPTSSTREIFYQWIRESTNHHCAISSCMSNTLPYLSLLDHCLRLPVSAGSKHMIVFWKVNSSHGRGEFDLQQGVI